MILELFGKPFPTERKPSKCGGNGERKAKEARSRESKK